MQPTETVPGDVRAHVRALALGDRRSKRARGVVAARPGSEKSRDLRAKRRAAVVRDPHRDTGVPADVEARVQGVSHRDVAVRCDGDVRLSGDVTELDRVLPLPAVE